MLETFHELLHRLMNSPSLAAHAALVDPDRDLPEAPADNPVGDGTAADDRPRTDQIEGFFSDSGMPTPRESPAVRDTGATFQSPALLPDSAAWFLAPYSLDDRIPFERAAIAESGPDPLPRPESVPPDQDAPPVRAAPSPAAQLDFPANGASDADIVPVFADDRPATPWRDLAAANPRSDPAVPENNSSVSLQHTSEVSSTFDRERFDSFAAEGELPAAQLDSVIESLDRRSQSADHDQSRTLERLEELDRRTLAAHHDLSRFADRLDQLEIAHMLRGRL